MCDARGNAVVVCSIENLDPMGVHTGDSWTIAPQQTLPDAMYQQLREAAFATARAVGVATGGANVQFAVDPSSARVPRDRDEPARLALLGARLEGDRLPDRQARRAARGRLHARRAAERHHRQDDRRLRAGARLRRDQGAPLRLREVPELLAPPRRRDARRRRGARARPHVRRGVRQGDGGPGGATRSTSRESDAELVALAAEPLAERWDLLLEAARRELELPGIHPYFAARLREVATLVAHAPHGRPRRLAVDSCAGEFEARTPYYYVTHEGEDEGPAAVGPRGDRARWRAEPDRTGDRVRLLLRPRGPGAAASSATRRCSSTRTPRRSRPTTTPPTGSTSSRSSSATCSRCARSSSRRRRRSPSAARRRSGSRRRSPPPACRCSATRSTRSTPPRTAAASPSSPATSRRRGGSPRRRRGARGRRIGSATRCSCGRTTCSAAAGCTSRAPPSELRVEGPCLVDRYLEGALELDVDALCDGEGAWVAAVLEHVEPTGVHSGDSACVAAGAVGDRGARGARSARSRRAIARRGSARAG